MLKYCTLMSFFILFFFFSSVSSAQEEDDICFDCHGDRTFIVEKEGKEVSLFVNRTKYKNSIHAENGCTSCHFDVDPDDLPHAEGLEKVDCSLCHDEPAEKYAESLHGQAKERGMRLAPSCITCHGKHDILPSDNENSKTYVMNVPNLCGTCHKEGTPVSKILNINQSQILENYSQSIHGDGLFRRGLIVTAVCTSCHNAHDILPHQNPKSSINRSNIPSTCMQCHSQIEKVHTKVIRGELWEKEPHELPICIDCHQPHKVRRVFYDESFPDKLCMSCHSKKDLYKEENGKKISLYVDYDEHSNSVHGKNSCYKCHTNISNSKNPVCKNSGKVDCSMCHSEVSENYAMSTHGTKRAEGNPDAPYCTDCHGKHNTQAKDDVNSPTFSRNIPELCGKCHREGEKAAKSYTGKDHEIVKHYTMSIHGKGLLQSGLMVTATCIDCHTSHRELPEKDPRSTVNPNNIATTCANCHLGIYEDFKTSIHSPEVSKSDKELPVCNDCHFSHEIKRVDVSDFRQGILDKCGRCHKEIAESYFETFHGKVSKLGALNTAKCYDCHGAHNILPTYDPKSTLHRNNIVETCKQCHPNSNHKFVGYLTHATHHDKDKYPYLYYTFWFMTILLVSTFTFFGIHTLMWMPRALSERRKQRRNKKNGK